MSKSALSTAVAISNSMIGTTMILFPITFNQTGIILNVLICIFMAAILGLTCKLLVAHVQPHESDVSASIRRKLGPTFCTVFSVLCALEVFLVSAIYFLLASDLCYCAIDSFTGGFSMSYKAFRIVLLAIFALLNYLPNLKYVLKATPVAMACLVLSVLVVIFSIPTNIDNISMDFFSMKNLSVKDIFMVAAMNGFAFIVHPTVTSTIKAHKDQRNNAKVVYWGFTISTLLYISVGVLGAMSVYGRVPTQDKETYNIIDYYSGQFQAPLIGILTVAYLFMISPIFPFVAKSQITKLIPQERRKNINLLGIKSSVIYSLLWVPCNLIFILWDVSPTLVINFISTVTAYFIAYLIPVVMTLKVGDYVVNIVDEERQGQLEASLISTIQQISEGKLNKYEKAVSQTTREDSERGNSTSIMQETTDIQLQLPDPATQITSFERTFYKVILVFGSFMFISELVFFFV